VVLGVITVLSIVGFIDHNAHRMDVSRILADVTDATRDAARTTWWPESVDDSGSEPTLRGPWLDVRSERGGWVQQLDVDGLLQALPESATAAMATRPGRYAIEGAPLARVFLGGDARVDDEGAPGTGSTTAEIDPSAVERGIRQSVVLGTSRTITQDPTYGLRQMVDVALKALSPGINDPTTAQDALFHLADGLRHVLLAEGPPERFHDDHGRWLVLESVSQSDLVELAFSQIARAAAPQPTVTAYLLAAIRSVMTGGDAHLSPAVRRALQAQADLALIASERAGTPEPDLDALRTRRAGFGDL